MAPGGRQRPPYAPRHDPPGPGIRNLRQLCPPWSWAPATTPRRSLPRSRLRLQTRRPRAGPAGPAPRRRPPPSAARDGEEEAARPNVRLLRPLLGSGPQGRTQKHPKVPQARAVTYLIISLQVLPGEVQHLLLGGCPVVVAHGFLGTGGEQGPRQPPQNARTTGWGPGGGALTGRGSKSSSCRCQRSRWKR